MGVGVSWSGAGCCRVSEGTLASLPSQACQSAPQGYDSDVGAGPGFAGQQLQGARHRQVTRPSPCQRIPGARASDGRGRRGRPRSPPAPSSSWRWPAASRRVPPSRPRSPAPPQTAASSVWSSEVRKGQEAASRQCRIKIHFISLFS